VSIHSTTTHWIRILPDGTREHWQGVPKDAEPHPSDMTCCCSRTRWVSLEDRQVAHALSGYLAEVNEPNPQPVNGLPCRGFTVTTEQHDDGPITVKETCEVLNMSNQENGRPFMARFSWTVGLPWEPPVTITPEGDALKIHDRGSGRLIATTRKPGMTPEQAMLELRAAMY
jgi:hypothetical protein